MKDLVARLSAMAEYLEFGRGPSDDIVLVTEILQCTRTTRTVWVENIQGHRCDFYNYSEFLSAAWREEPRVIN